MFPKVYFHTMYFSDYKDHGREAEHFASLLSHIELYFHATMNESYLCDAIELNYTC